MTSQDSAIIKLNEDKISRINREIALADNESIIDTLEKKRGRIEKENQQIKDKYATTKPATNRLEFLRTCVMGMGSYRGVIVEKVVNGYKVGSELAKSADEVDQIIDARLNNFQKTISNETQKIRG